jgi:uncharacterized protein (TIRG00374 family)
MTNVFKSRVFRTAAGYVLAAVCLAWVFHNTQWNAFARSVAAFRWAWAALAIVVELLSFVGQALRWRLLLSPLGSVGLLRTTQAVYCGLGMNYVVPMGFGEVTRGYFMSGLMSRSFVSVLPSIALERLFDAVWLAVGIGITAVAVRLPRDLNRAAGIFGGIVLALIGLIFFLLARKGKDGETGRSRPVRGGRLGRGLSRLLERLGDGFRSIGFTRRLLGAFLISLLVFALQVASLWLLMRAYGLRLSFGIGAAVFFITLFGTALPIAPAGIGTYQFFCVIGLTLCGVGKAQAAGFSLVAYVVLNAPLLAIGLFALSKCGMTLTAIKEKLRAQRAKRT